MPSDAAISSFGLAWSHLGGSPGCVYHGNRLAGRQRHKCFGRQTKRPLDMASAPTLTTGFGRLPPELSSWIFELVSAGSRRDVANSRLACRELHSICSPFLITTVVVANRLETLKLAMEVMQHPYFSKHVTHFLWDASWYEKDIALKVGEYQSRASQSSHIVTSRTLNTSPPGRLTRLFSRNCPMKEAKSRTFLSFGVCITHLLQTGEAMCMVAHAGRSPSKPLSLAPTLRNHHSLTMATTKTLAT